MNGNYSPNWIERQLGYGERNSVRAAYNFAQYLPERRRMIQEWADYLDALRAGKDGQSTEPLPMTEGSENGNIVTFRRR